MSDRLVKLAVFSDAATAHMAKARLAAAGIDSAVLDENVTSVLSHLGAAIGGVKLLVHEADAARAAALLAEAPGPAVSIASEEPTAADPAEEVGEADRDLFAPDDRPDVEPCCPACGSSRLLAPRDSWAGAILAAAAFVVSAATMGLPRFRSPRRWHCLACGTSWRPGEPLLGPRGFPVDPPS